MQKTLSNNHQWTLLLVAIMFYSRIPVPRSLPHSDDLLNESRVYFPAVGIIIGCIGAVVLIMLAQILPLNISVLLSITATILATGAFHEDGFADSCDGLGGGWSKEQVLTIMKDSRIGTYGSVGLFLILTIKFLTVLSLATVDLKLGCLSLLLSHTVSRVFASTIIEFFDYVQDIDKSKVKPITERRLNKAQWKTSISIACLPVAIFLIVYWQTIMSIILILAVSAFICWCFAKYCQKRIGGFTGDTLGATQQLSEVSIYLLILVTMT